MQILDELTVLTPGPQGVSCKILNAAGDPRAPWVAQRGWSLVAAVRVARPTERTLALGLHLSSLMKGSKMSSLASALTLLPPDSSLMLVTASS